VAHLLYFVTIFHLRRYMEQPLCAICQKVYYPRTWKEDFCNNCYHKFQEAILNHEPWVRVCINEEYRRRHQDTYSYKGKRQYVNIVYGLGDDIDVLNGKLIYLKEKNNGSN
jgi:hypothetical protein